MKKTHLIYSIVILYLILVTGCKKDALDSEHQEYNEISNVEKVDKKVDSEIENRASKILTQLNGLWLNESTNYHVKINRREEYTNPESTLEKTDDGYTLFLHLAFNEISDAKISYLTQLAFFRELKDHRYTDLFDKYIKETKEREKEDRIQLAYRDLMHAFIVFSSKDIKPKDYNKTINLCEFSVDEMEDYAKKYKFDFLFQVKEEILDDRELYKQKFITFSEEFYKKFIFEQNEETTTSKNDNELTMDIERETIKFVITSLNNYWIKNEGFTFKIDYSSTSRENKCYIISGGFNKQLILKINLNNQNKIKKHTIVNLVQLAFFKHFSENTFERNFEKIKRKSQKQQIENYTEEEYRKESIMAFNVYTAMKLFFVKKEIAKQYYNLYGLGDEFAERLLKLTEDFKYIEQGADNFYNFENLFFSMFDSKEKFLYKN